MQILPAPQSALVAQLEHCSSDAVLMHAPPFSMVVTQRHRTPHAWSRWSAWHG